MSRLPNPGSDNGQWGTILNDYLTQSHKQDGTLKDDSVTRTAIAADAVSAAEIEDGTISEAQLTTAVQTKLNAVASTPDWSTITNKPAVIAAGATQADARTAIGAGTSNLVIGTTSTTAKAGDYTPTKSDVGLGSVDNTSDIDKPISTATQTALDTKLTVHNIVSYGAVGDDATDCAAAIQAAIAAAAIDGLPVYVPPGRYRISTSVVMRAGTVLVGSNSSGFGDGTQPTAGTTSQIVAQSSMNQPLISGPVGAGHVRIRDIHLDCNKNQNTGTSGIYIADVTGDAEEAQWVIERVFVEAAAVNALYIGEGRRAVKVAKSWCMYSGQHGVVVKGSDAGIDSVIVGGSGQSGIMVLAPVARITNCDIFGNAQSGIVISDAINMVHVSGNGIDKNGTHGIYLGSDSFNNVISGNLFHSNSNAADWSAHHIFVAGDHAAGTSILGNSFGGDSGYTNLPGWCVYIDGDATLYAYGNMLEPGTVHSGLISDVSKVL